MNIKEKAISKLSSFDNKIKGKSQSLFSKMNKFTKSNIK